MLKRQKPTLSPSRFKNNDLKNLSESILNVCNRSILDEQLVLPTTVSTAVSSAVMGSGSSTGTAKKKSDRDNDGIPDEEDAAPDSKNYEGDSEKDTQGSQVPARKDPVPSGPVIPNVKSAEDLKKSSRSPLTPGTDMKDPDENKPIFGGRGRYMGSWRERREGKPSSFQGGGFKGSSTGGTLGPKEKVKKGDIMYAQRDYAISGDATSGFDLTTYKSEKAGNVNVMKDISQPAKDYLAKTGTAKKFSMPGYDYTSGMDYLQDQAKLVAATTALKAGMEIPAGLGAFGVLALLQAGKIGADEKSIADLSNAVSDIGRQPPKPSTGSTGPSVIGTTLDPAQDVERFTDR